MDVIIIVLGARLVSSVCLLLLMWLYVMMLGAPLASSVSLAVQLSSPWPYPSSKTKVAAHASCGIHLRLMPVGIAERRPALCQVNACFSAKRALGLGAQGCEQHVQAMSFHASTIGEASSRS